MKATLVALYHRIYDLECKIAKEKIDYQYFEEEPLYDTELQRLRLAIRKAQIDEMEYTLRGLKKDLEESQKR